MFASTILTPSQLKTRHFVFIPPNTNIEVPPTRSRAHWRSKVSGFSKFAHQSFHLYLKSNIRPTVAARVLNGDDEAFDATSTEYFSPPTDIEEVDSISFGLDDSSVALFVRMLGLDHDPHDRERAITALWRYSLDGYEFHDNLMQFPGCINLIVNLLRSDSTSASEAAAGILRSLSSVNQYRNLVAESGAIEEINRLLRQSSLDPKVKEQSICTLWNLSVDEKVRIKLANDDILPWIIKYLEDEDIFVVEAAGGILANLALSHVNHNNLVEAGVIPKLAKFLTSEPDFCEGVGQKKEKSSIFNPIKFSPKEFIPASAWEEGDVSNLAFGGTNFSHLRVSEIIKKEARKALLEFLNDEYYKILVLEEGLVPVPLIGTEAYKSYPLDRHSAPILPDGTEIVLPKKDHSRYGASDLLLGLNEDKININVDETVRKVILGWANQQFLLDRGFIELEENDAFDSVSSNRKQLTLLRWNDGVARLAIILQLRNKSAIKRAAESIADISINERMRVALKEAGVVKHLVWLLNCDDDAIRLAITKALERLSASNTVCQKIESLRVLGPLVNILKSSDISQTIAEKSLIIIARILDPIKEMESMLFDGPINESEKALRDCRNLSKKDTRKEVLDSAFVDRLVKILKSSSPNLQAKAASVLEFVAWTEPNMVSLIFADIESALDEVFKQKNLRISGDEEDDVSKAYPIEVEEAGLAISAACRLMTRLLDYEQFREKVNASHFISSLRKILKSDIPLHCKSWVAACLVKLSPLSGGENPRPDPINMEVIIYETVPRLTEQIKTSSSMETQESAVVELNRIISEEGVDTGRAIVSKGAISPLVKLIEEGSERAIEAGLAILYNLSMDSENHSLILDAGAVSVLRRIVRSESPHWEKALHLFRNLPT